MTAMNPRTLIPLGLLGLLIALVPAALAQETGECPDGEECVVESHQGEGIEEGPTYDGNCGGEVCAYDEGTPHAFGPEDCIECSTPPVDATSTEDDEIATNPTPFPALLGIVATLGAMALLGLRRR